MPFAADVQGMDYFDYCLPAFNFRKIGIAALTTAKKFYDTVFLSACNN
jgi:hypothetical protein